MKPLAFALIAALLGTPTVAQEAPLMPTPPPTDFTKPFQLDRSPFYDVVPRALPEYEDSAIPVEVIGVEELIAMGDPTMEELVRRLSEIGSVQSQSARGARASGVGVSTLNLRTLGSGGVMKIPPAEARPAAPVPAKEPPVAAPHCYFDRGESIDLEGRALSCRGTLTVRTHDDPGP